MPERPLPGGRALRFAAAVLAVPLVLSGCGAVDGSTDPPPVGPITAPTPVSEPTAAEAPIVEGRPPRSVSIPAIGLSEPLTDLGIADDGTMEVPVDYDAVGWFTGGGRPGGYGPTVIAGHVDSPTGPAVFLRLGELRPGDVVEVVDIDGSAHGYEVTEVADYPKSDFPTVRVFGATRGDELRLITCGGVFDREASSYTDNRVVYATAVPST